MKKLRRPRPLLLAAVLTLAASIAAASQVVVVTPTPSNPTQSGNDLLTALAGISGNSWNKRFVLQLEPGVYNLGNQNIQMKEYVDIAGSGVETTFIYGNGNTATDGIFRGLIQGASYAELRDLTVRVYAASGRQYLVPVYLTATVNTRITNIYTQAFTAEEYCGGIVGQGSSAVIQNVLIRSTCAGDASGIDLRGTFVSGRPSIAHVDVVASSTNTSQFATALRLATGAPPLELRDSAFVASGGGAAAGIELFTPDGIPPGGSLITIRDTTFAAKNGFSYSNGLRVFTEDAPALSFRHSTLQATGSPFENHGIHTLMTFCNIDITFEHGLIEGSTNAVLNHCSAAHKLEIGAARLVGGPAIGNGTTTCAGVYDENFTFSASTCP